MSTPLAVYALPRTPVDPTRILGGIAITPGGTIITVPKGRVWEGTITLGGSGTVSPGGGALTANVRADLEGAGARPFLGSVNRLDLSAPAVGNGSQIGIAINESQAVQMIIAAGPVEDAVLKLQSLGVVAQVAIAIGLLID